MAHVVAARHRLSRRLGTYWAHRSIPSVKASERKMNPFQAGPSECSVTSTDPGGAGRRDEKGRGRGGGPVFPRGRQNRPATWKADRLAYRGKRPPVRRGVSVQPRCDFGHRSFRNSTDYAKERVSAFPRPGVIAAPCVSWARSGGASHS